MGVLGTAPESMYNPLAAATVVVAAAVQFAAAAGDDAVAVAGPSCAACFLNRFVRPSGGLAAV